MAAIETAVSGTVIFAFSTGNHDIITSDHVEIMLSLETQGILTTRSTSLAQRAGRHENRHRKAPLFVSSTGNITIFSFLDRVVKRACCNQARTVHCRMCRSSRVPTTLACASEVQKTVEVPQVQYTQELDLDDYAIAKKTLQSAFLFARTQTTQCRSSTLTGSSTSQCLGFLSRSWKP